MPRELKFFQAIHEATRQCMEQDPAVYLVGLGAPDPKGIFGSTLDLHKIFGPQRVMDMPASENAMTGVVIGSALAGMKPILTHQRLDFALLSVEQLVNQASNWHYMFGGQKSIPIVVRMIVGRGWGQGPQHSQSLHACFSHVPGLKVVMPSTPHDAKGLLIAAVEDSNPVIYIEHRWLYNISGEVPVEPYRVELGKARVARNGTDLTIVASSYMTLESLRAAEILQNEGVSAEVIDVRTLKPLDRETILQSVCRTGRLIAADIGWCTNGFSAEILALAAEQAFESLKAAPVRVALPDCPTPTSPALAKHYYPRAIHVAAQALKMLGVNPSERHPAEPELVHYDVPDPSFTGPF
ncbi:MAG: transketolase C-terminal domain-containing protein [Thermodesulfobacteriota bacterium]